MEKQEKKRGGPQILNPKDRARRALRCVVLMSLLQQSYWQMSIRLAECPLYQGFCELKVPSKSELNRFVQMVELEVVRDLNESLIDRPPDL